MDKMFCIIGETGAGKSTYLNYILKYKDDHGLDDIHRLVYHTTRKPRAGEKDGVDYHFSKEKPPSLVSVQNMDTGGYGLAFNPGLVEERTYQTMNDGTVHYYTTVDNVRDDYYICAPSIEQLNSYLKYFGPEKIVVIEIDTKLKTRIKRVLDNRAKTDADIYELCRRIVQEKTDWEKAGYSKLVPKLHHYLLIDNTKESDFEKNAEEIFEYIKEQFHKA